MNSSKQIHPLKLNQWSKLISVQKSSGLNVRQWCKRNKVLVNAYSYWKRILKNESSRSDTHDIVPVISQTSLNESPD